MNRPRNNRRFNFESLERRELMTADPGWAFLLGGAGSLSAESTVTVGPDDHLYVTGSFTGAIDFDPGPGTNQVVTPVNVQYGYIAKYTQQGGLVWANTFSGNGSWGEFSRALEFDAAGSLYIAGMSNSTATQFGSTTLASQGSYDVFVAKASVATGAFIWAKGVGGPGEEQAVGLAVSDAGDVYVTGMFSNTVDFDPATNSVHELTAAGSSGLQDGYVLKLNSQGNFVWARQFGGEQSDSGHRIALGDDGDVYAVGHFRGTVDFGSPENPLPLTGPASNASNAYFVRLDQSTGETNWARQMSGERNGAARVAFDGLGSVYVAGDFDGSITLGSGPTLLSEGGADGYLSKWDAEGNVLWAESFGDGPGDAYCHTLRVDAQGRPMLALNFDGTADLDPGPGLASFTSVDNNDGALLRLDTNGGFISARQYKGPGDTRAFTVDEDSLGNVYVSGLFQNSVSLPTGDTLTRSGNGIFVNKIAVAAPTKFFVVDGTADNTHEYDASGNRTDNYVLNSANSNSRGAASNVAGDKVWVVDANKKVYVYNIAGGLLGSWTANGLSSPTGITTNGTDVWIVDSSTDKVYKYTSAASRLSGSQSAASNFNLNNQNGNATDLVTNGTNIWTVNSAATDKVFRYSMTGTLQGSWTIDSRNTSPTGITLDPASPSTLWIVDNATDQVFAYAGATSRTSGSQAAAIAVNLGQGNSDPQGIADPPALADEVILELSRESVLTRNAEMTEPAARPNIGASRLAADQVFSTLFGSSDAVAPKRMRRLANFG
ncbi:MAG: hypothetical protein SGJ19_08140 [Planctomycetia bacterium]|nr:hypothetical protein [Planctomycetia bacterium]